MDAKEAKALEKLLMKFCDELFQKMFVSYPPFIMTSKNIHVGYRAKVKNEKPDQELSEERQSIRLKFYATQPSREEVLEMVQFFLHKEKLAGE